MYSVTTEYTGTDTAAANSFMMAVRSFGTALRFSIASPGGNRRFMDRFFLNVIIS